ncbi:MAG: DegV family protein, partial [Bacilli bacterium]|nr:DegV family protein [Bacilli bacterium]
MKKDIQLSSEDVIDLTPEELNAWDIKVIPFLCEDASTPLADLHKKLAETGEPMLVSAPKVAQFEEHFYDLLSDAEHIIHFSASSYLSAGYNSAVVASHENSNITVIDTHGNSGAIALLAFYARDLISMGYGYKEIVALLLERRDRIERSFLCESIAVLGAYRMIPKKSLFAAKLFKTRAEFVYGTEGELRFGKRYHGS